VHDLPYRRDFHRAEPINNFASSIDAKLFGANKLPETGPEDLIGWRWLSIKTAQQTSNAQHRLPRRSLGVGGNVERRMQTLNSRFGVGRSVFGVGFCSPSAIPSPPPVRPR
jgi:hypothetical protein